MKEENGNTFRIVFCGQLIQGRDQAEAEKGVAQLLRMSPDQVRDFFNGIERFVRDDLDFLTAIRLQRAFADAGTVCLLQPMVYCIACDFRQQKGKRCRKCKKPLSLISKTATHAHANQQTFNNDDFIQRKRARNAIIGLGLGISIQMGTEIIDDVLLYYAIDFWWMYGLSLLPLLYGCWNYIRLKAFSPYWVVPCLFPLFGLGLLLLLPERSVTTTPEAKRIRYRQMLGGVMALLGLIWLWQTGMNQHRLGEFERESYAMHQLIVNQPDIKMAEYDAELTTFLEHGFSVANSISLRPDTANILIAGMFRSVTDFFMWAHARKYQQIMQEGSAENELSYYALAVLKKKYARLMKKNINDLNNDYLTLEYKRWVIQDGSEEQFEFGGCAGGIVVRMITEGRLYYRETGRFPGANDFYPPLELSCIERFNMDQDGKMTMTFNGKFPRAKGKSAVFAMFLIHTPPRWKGERDTSSFTILRIGGDLDDYYLVNQSMFIGWSEPDDHMVIH
jgi:hypothetical protein